MIGTAHAKVHGTVRHGHPLGAKPVLQVLGLIDANLLAAYSSNLFGIVCVALVKIRHVRPYKRQLIIEIQSGAA